MAGMTTRAAKDRAEKVVRQHKTLDNWRARQYVFSEELLFMSSSIVFFLLYFRCGADEMYTSKEQLLTEEMYTSKD